MAKRKKVETRGRPPKKGKKSDASKETAKSEEEMHLPTDSSNDNSNASDPVTVEEPLNSNGLSLKKTKPNTPTSSVRRSSRLSPNQDTVPITKHANTVESEKEEGPLVQRVSSMPTPVERNAYKVTQRPREGPSDGLNYRTLYFESQKKIDHLLETNLQLHKDVQFYRGKIEAYENMKALMATPREVIYINNSGEAKEHIANLFPQTGLGNSSSPARIASPNALDDTKEPPGKRKYTRRDRKAKS